MSSTFNRAFNLMSIEGIEQQAQAFNEFVFESYLDLEKLINISESLKTVIVTTEDQNDLEVFASFCFFSILTVYERMRQERLNGWDECLAILRPKSFYTTLLLMHVGYRVATDHEFLENLEPELSPASAAGRTPKNVLISLLHGDPFLAISQNDSVDTLCVI